MSISVSPLYPGKKTGTWLVTGRDLGTSFFLQEQDRYVNVMKCICTRKENNVKTNNKDEFLYIYESERASERESIQKKIETSKCWWMMMETGLVVVWRNLGWQCDCVAYV